MSDSSTGPTTFDSSSGTWSDSSSTGVNGTDTGCPDGALTCTTTSIYIATLNRSDFFKAFLMFGIPCIICGLIGGWAFRRAQFKIRLLPSVVSMLTFKNLLGDDKTLEKALAWICLFIILIAALPSVFILLWGIWVYSKINHLLGFAIFLILMAFQMTAYGFSHWKVNGWRIDRLVKILLALSVLSMWTFEIWTIYLEKPFTYWMLSVVYISFNMIPMTILTYLVAQTMTKPLEGYEKLDVDPVEDYMTYLKEVMKLQKQKLQTDEKQPIVGGGIDGGAASGAGVVKIHLAQDDKSGQQSGGDEKKDQTTPAVGGLIEVRPAASKDDSTTAVTIFESFGVKPPEEKYRTPAWKKWACYFAACVILLIYSISVNFIKDSGGFGNVVGWITSGTIMILDLTVWLCVYGGKITQPLNAVLYQGACRIILIVFGDIYWFIGHSMMYVVLAIFFGTSIVDSLLPKLNGAQQKTGLIDGMVVHATGAAAGAAGGKGAFGESSDDSIVEIEAQRNSEQLGIGFMKHGRFSSTRLGKSLFAHIEFYAFGILTAAFLIDLIVCSAKSTVDLHFSETHKQYLVGVLCLFLTGICLSSQFIYRMYYNRDFRIDWKLLFSCLLQWVICVGCGGFLYDRTRSVILISFFCFLPPVVYLSTFGYIEWMKNDFQLYLDPNEKPVAPGKGGKTREQKHHSKSPSNSNSNNNSLAIDVAPDPNSPIPPTPITPADIIAREREQEEQKSPGADGGGIFIPTDSGIASEKASLKHVQTRMEIKEIQFDLGRYNSLKKYQIVVAWLCAGILVIGMGSTIAAHSTPAYVGYSIMAVILILASTCLPIIEWFNSFQISKNMIVQLCTTTVFFIAFIVIFWIQGLDKANNNKSLALLFTLFIYPTLVVLIFAVVKWRDDKYVMSSFVKTALVICCALITTFLIVVAVVYDPWVIGAALLVAFMVILFGSFLVPILTKRFPWLIKWTILIGILILIGFAAGVGSQPNNGFIGFSLAWGILFCCLLVSAWQSHRNTSNVNIISHLHSPNLFPVFSYDLSPGLRNPLKPDDRRVYLVFLTLFTSCVWGILAVFFLQTTWIGLGVHAISIVLMIIYSYECITQPRILLANAVRYLGEGSPTYLDAIHRAKLAAFKSQLSSIKSTSTSPDQQLSPRSPTDRSPSPSPSPRLADEEEEKKLPERSLTLAQEATKIAEADSLLLDEADLKVLGLDDPSRPLTELDWKGLYQTFCQLRILTPNPRFFAFVQGKDVSVSQVPWRGMQLSRRRAHELLLKLDHHIAQLHLNFLSYQTQIQVEIILGVQGVKAERELEILTMLRDTGYANATIEYIRGLKPNSPERKQLEDALVQWKQQQEFIAQERQRKRKEEEANTLKREEEERRRIREEEQKLIRLRQDQAVLDSEAAVRKQEELRRAQEAEKLRLEEDAFRRQQAAQLEQERLAREKAEVERKAREAEIEAKLRAEANEKQLAILRQQQEQARVAEEQRRIAEKKKLDQLAAEQAARDLALAAEREFQSKVALAVKKRCCTLNETGEKFVTQQWYQCLTCGAPNNQGCCEVCKDICHAGHQLKNCGVSAFYCDCGRSGCEAATGVKPGMKGKPTIQSIETKHAQTGEKWNDPDFPPSAAALLRDPASSTRQDWKQLLWKRPEEMPNMKKPVLFESGADPLDINQGQIGDCWFMSALSVMTQRQKDLMNIFVSKEHSAAGVYSVNFWKNGERINVLIDSNFPATKQNMAAFGRSANDNELWVMILEKAYAKLHRSYESIESGFVDQALVDLSGGIGSRIDMSKDPAKKEAKTGQLFQQLLAYHNAGFLLGAGSPAGSDSEANASASGIVQGHAYSILAVSDVDGNQLIRLRNPWGRKEWNGDWSDNSDKWTRRLKAKLNWVAADDGAFWMNMIDFSRHFEEIYVCRFFDTDKGWLALDPIRGEWKGPTAGGCTNYDTVKDNPQYLLTVTQPTNVVINLAQTDSRGTSEKLKPIAIEVYSNKGQRVTRTRTGPLICSNPESYIFRREVSLEQQLEPGVYTVLISTFNQGEETKFAIQVFATQPVKMEVAPPAPAKAAKK